MSEQIDERVKGVVSWINSHQGLKTVGSCGGHKDPRHDQVPEGDFYVQFIFPRGFPTKEGWSSLKLITCYISELEFIENESLRIITDMTMEGLFFFRLEGHNYDLSEFS